MADMKGQPPVVVTNYPQPQSYGNPMSASQQTSLVRGGAAGCCSICLIILGIFLLFAGAALTGVGYMITGDDIFGEEITGPKALQIVGPILLAIGLILIVTAIIVCVCVVRKVRESGVSNLMMNHHGPVIAGGGTGIHHSGPVGGMTHHGGFHNGGMAHGGGMSDHGFSGHDFENSGFSHGGGISSSSGGGFSSGGGDFSSGGGMSSGGDL